MAAFMNLRLRLNINNIWVEGRLLSFYFWKIWIYDSLFCRVLRHILFSLTIEKNLNCFINGVILTSNHWYNNRIIYLLKKKINSENLGMENKTVIQLLYKENTQYIFCKIWHSETSSAFIIVQICLQIKLEM